MKLLKEKDIGIKSNTMTEELLTGMAIYFALLIIMFGAGLVLGKYLS